MNQKCIDNVRARLLEAGLEEVSSICCEKKGEVRFRFRYWPMPAGDNAVYLEATAWVGPCMLTKEDIDLTEEDALQLKKGWATELLRRTARKAHEALLEKARVALSVAVTG